MASLMQHYYKWRQRRTFRDEGGRKALILAWSHASNTVLSLAGSLAGGLTANDVDVTILNLSDKRQRRKLGSFPRRYFSQVFLMGSVPLRYNCNGLPIHDYFEADIYFWVLDPIIYDLDRTKETRDYFEKSRQCSRLHCLFPDSSYIQFVESWIGTQSIYFPFAGNFNREGEENNFYDANAQKRSGIVVLANIGQELNDRASQSLREIIEAIDPFGLSPRQRASLAEHVMNDEAHSNIAISVGNFMQIPFQEMYDSRIISFLAALDASEKRRRRVLVIDSIRTLNIDIIGSGWQKILGDRPNITYSAKPVQHEFLGDFFAGHRVLLDFSPNWDHGFNDRVITSIGAGCRVVTSRNAAVAELGDAATLVSSYTMVHPEPEATLDIALNAPPVDENLISRIKADQNWHGRVSQLLS